jgi:alkyl hydroperoxide reductase subunit AhpF
MRIIDSIPHPSITISIFQMNDKYMVKFEAGPMEQTFKYLVVEVGSVEGLKQKINEDFIEKVRLRFNDMFKQMKGLV